MFDLVSIILPVLFIFTIGFISQKRIGFSIPSISSLSIYILSPCLAFYSFYTNELSMDYVYILFAMLLLTFVLIVICYIVGKSMRASKAETSALVLSNAFMNAGNYGAPVILFAYGATGFEYAVIVLVINSLLMNTLGVFFAALGSSHSTKTIDAIKNALRMPVLYAVVIAIALNILHIHLPAFTVNGIELISQASVPVFMLVLGMQLAVISLKRVRYHLLTASTIIRLVISPIAAFLIIQLFPVSDLIKSIFIIQMAMPAAVNTTLFALKFDTEPDLVSFTTFVTTVLSIITIPIILYLAGI